MLKSFLLATSIILGGVSNSYAESFDLQNNEALKINSVSVFEVETLPALSDLSKNESPVGGIIKSIDGIIAIGQKIWKIVDAGRPVVTTKLAPMVSVLPQVEGNNSPLNKMANWSAPSVKSYRVSFKNVYNKEIVGFTYTIYFQFNGSLNGIGKYITNLKVQASEIYIAWGFNFDAVSELVGIANVGSVEAPVASATLQISYVVKGLINESRGSQGFYADGAGNIQTIP